MRKQNIILSLICSFLVLGSCSQDNKGPVYTPDGVETSFLQASQNAKLAEEDNGKFFVDVVRTESSGETPTNFVLSSVFIGNQNVTDKGIFTLESKQATFDGVYGKVQLNYNLNLMDPSLVYVVTLVNKGENISPTKVSAVINATRKVSYKDYTNATVVSSDWGHSSLAAPWKIKVQKAEGYDFYRLVDLYGPGINVEFHVNSKEQIIALKQKTGEIHSSYGDISVASPAAPGIRKGKEYTLKLEFTVSAGSFGTMTDKIVFD